MKQTVKRSLALLMALIMCISFLPATRIVADAAEFEYVYSSNGKYIYNWGNRGETATSLSPNATAFYTETTYDELSQLAGGTGTSNAPSSALYAALQKLMKDNHDYVTSYDATRDLYQYTDCQNSGKDTKAISSFYSGKSIGPAWDSGATWNREHTWPNSKGDAAGNGENDIMMLRPASTNENGSRGNKAYGESSGYYFPNTESGGTYDVRGDVARIILYVYVRWGCTNTGSGYNPTDIFGTAGVIESMDVLLKWMEQDPVDTWELGRNDSVEAITGTRNVFVDYPELAFLLFGADIPADMTTPSGEATKDCGHNNFDTGVVTAPTCTAKGYTTFTCQTEGCNYSYKGQFVDATGHAYDNGICTGCGQEEPAAPVVPTYVMELETGVAYKLGLYSTDKSAEYYFTGVMSSYYGATDTAFDKGVDMFVEETAGGYYLYFFNSSNAKQYVNLVASGDHRNFTFAATASSVFTWDADKDALCTTVEGEVCYIGTYGPYVTMGVLQTAKLKDTDYIARMYVMGNNTGGETCQHTNQEVLPSKAATCGADGLTEGKKCTDCGAVLVAQQPIPATGDHNYENGACTGCGKSEPTGIQATITFDDKAKRTEYSSNIQVWEENGIVVTNEKGASTSNVGDYAKPARFYKSSKLTIAYPGMTSMEIDCSGLESKYVDGWLVVTGATATNNGGIITIVFASPVDSFTYATMSAQSRAYSITVYTAAETPDPSCQHTNTETLPAKAPTCTETGLTEGSKCADCGEILVAQEEIPGTGVHTYENGICTGCGKSESTTPEQPTEGLTPGVGYKITANNANGPLWYKGSITNGRFDASTNEADAVLVYVELANGGYRLYSLSETTKTYINMADNSSGGSFTTDATAATIYEWNAELKTLEVADDTNARGFGCDPTKTYNNFSSYAVSNGSSYSWGQFIPVTGAEPEPTPAPAAPTKETVNPMTPAFYVFCTEHNEEGTLGVYLAPDYSVFGEMVRNEQGQWSISYTFQMVKFMEDVVLTQVYENHAMVETFPETVEYTLVWNEDSQLWEYTHVALFYAVAPALADGCEHFNTVTVTENEVKPTCTAAGSYDSVVRCEDCGEELSRETVAVAAIGHSYAGVVTAPTCTAIGYTTYTCAACGDAYVADEVVPTGHLAENRVETAYVAPTQNTVGYTAGVYCNGCQSYLYGHQQIAALGYTVRFITPESVNGVSSVSGVASVTLPAAVAPEGFTFVGWTTAAVEPTANAPAQILLEGDILNLTGDVVLYALYSYSYTSPVAGALSFFVSDTVAEINATAAPMSSGGTAYVKITSLDQLVSGKYVMIVNNGYAPTKYDSSGWLLSGKPTVSGDTVTDPDNYIWTLTVNGTSVTIQDATGTFIKPKSGNNNGIQTGSYNWTVVFADGTFQFMGTGSDTTTLAANTQSSSKFRAYKNATVSGNASGYPSQFTLYKLTEISEIPEPECQHTNTTVEGATPATCAEPGHTGKTICTDCGETINEGEEISATGHNYENGFCTICNEPEPAAPVGPVTVTVSIADYASKNGWTNDTQYPTLKMDPVVTITATGGQYTGKYFTSGNQWRIYQTDSGKITFTAENAIIKSVKITYGINNSGVLTFNGANITSGAIVEVNAESATFGVGNTGGKTNGQVRITAIEVVYVGNGTSECQHENTERQNAVAATCTEPGYTGDLVCLNCGETLEQGEPISATGHNYVGGFCVGCGEVAPVMYTTVSGDCAHATTELKRVNFNATCTAPGYTGDLVCSTCGDTLVEGTAITTQHIWSEATCINAKTCGICGETDGEPAAHTPSEKVIGAKEVTCYEDGYTGDIFCAACGELLQQGEILPAGHLYAGTVTKTPSTTVTGTMKLVCARCDESVDIELPALNETDYTFQVLEPATATADGIGCYVWNVTDYGAFAFNAVIRHEVKQTDAQIVLQDATNAVGQTVRVNVLLQNNPGLNRILAQLVYDESVLTLVSVENGTVMSMDSNLLWTADANTTADGVLCTLVFRIAEDAALNYYPISLVLVEATNQAEEAVELHLVSATVAVTGIIYGDVTGDGVISLVDVLRLRKYLANRNPDTNESTVTVEEGADVNGDGKINLPDVLRLRQYLVNRNPLTGAGNVVLGPQ